MPSKRPRLSSAQAVARIQGQSSPAPADDLVGVELEWLVTSTDATRRAEVDHRQTDDLALPGGSALTIEPAGAGQLELSSRPRSSVAALYAEMAADVRDLGDRVAGGGTRLVGMGLAPGASTPRVASTRATTPWTRSSRPTGRRGRS